MHFNQPDFLWWYITITFTILDIIPPSFAFSNVWKAIKWLQNYDKPQNITVSKFSTEQNNVAEIIEYLKET
jgi:hypothetical protein